MNLDSLSCTLSQISHIVTNLTKKNYKSSQTEISVLIEKQGFEAERHLYRCLFSVIDFNTENKTSGNHQTQLLKEAFNSLISKPYFISIINFAIDNPLQYQEPIKSSSNILTNISKTLKLNRIQELALAIALQHSSKEEIRKKSSEFLKQKLAELTVTDNNKDTNFNEVPIEVLQLILTELGTNPYLNYSDFLLKLRKDFPREKVPPILIPYLYSEENFEIKDQIYPDNLNNKKIIMENPIAEVIQELGYAFTSSPEECKKQLLSMGQPKDILTQSSIAKILGMMARTHSNLSHDNSIINPSSMEFMNEIHQTWNTDIFVSVVNELVPNISWKEVVKEFDYPEFIIKDKLGLRIIVTAVKKGLKDQTFPIEYLHRIWKNTEAQLSWIAQSLKHPDVFCMADHQSRRTVTECLKAQPEEDNKLISSWRSLNLIETLLLISENGFYSTCVELFKSPITHCPDLLLLGLLQLNTILNKLKQELISILIPIFLGNHPNSAVILQYAWNQNSHVAAIRSIIMNSMVDWYMKASEADQNSRLARILDVSQDIKALSILLNGHPMVFNIDLACLAARRGYLKLDKWLSDRMRDHGELFISIVVSFLRRKVPQLSGMSNKDEQNMNMNRPLQTSLLPETIQTILKCISNSTVALGPDISQELIQLNLDARAIFEKNNIGQKNLPNPNQNIGSQNNFDLIQSMMNNMNLNNINNTSSFNFTSINSPSKIFTPTLGIQNPLQSINLNSSVPSLAGYGAQNMLLNNATSLDSNKVAALNNLLTNQTFRMQNYPQNIMRPTNSPQNDPLDPTYQNYTKEMEEKVEECIMRLFKTVPMSGSLGVDEFADILAKFKDSLDKKEKDFYAQALKYLIDGNTCLNSLDDMQFNTMANLWGVLIERGILSNNHLAYCLKLLLQMLYRPTTKHFFFASKVLDRSKNRIKDYSDFCQYVTQVPNYSDLPKVLRDYIDFGARTMLTPMASLQQPLRSLTPPNSSPYNNAQTQQIQRNLSIASNQLNSSNLINNSTMNKNQQMITSPQSSILNSSNVNANQTVANHMRSVGGKPSIANATNIDTLLVANENDIASKPIPPSEAVQDKIGFIFNNLSLSNMQAKSDELKDTLKDEFWDWIAHYLVVKRVSIEPNFHVLYSQFIDTLKKELLNQGVLSETYRNIKVLLRSDKNEQKFCDRALLKNLGSWLGLITLAKNKPILHKDIDLKSLIIEAFHKGQSELLFVVPFVSKILEPANKSRIFQPPNPWLMAILSVLVELHNEPDLKLNHKFEIEVLCKNLSINITDIPVKNILRNYEIVEEQLTKRSDISNKGTVLSSAVNSTNNAILGGPQPNPQTNMAVMQTTNTATMQGANGHILTPQTSSQIHQELPQGSIDSSNIIQQIQSNNAYTISTPLPKYKLGDIKAPSIQNNAHLIYINPEIPLLNTHPILKNYIMPALDRAVNEIQQLLLEKAVKISINTAELLIKKDFALEPDENRIRLAARNMIANMSSGMMLITGKEPLTSHLLTTLKMQLSQPLDQALATAFKDMINQACTIIVQDNIEFCMCYLQKNAIQRAFVELEKKLAPEFEIRQRARNENRVHYDMNEFAYQNEKMPELIRIRPGSVGSQHFSVYDEFGKSIPGFKVHVDEKPINPNFNHPTDEMNVHYEHIAMSLENDIAIMPPNNLLTINLQNLLAAVQEFKINQSPISALNLVKRLVYNILENCAIYNDMMSGLTSDIITRCRERNFSVVKIILNDQRFIAGNWIVKEVQKIWLECTQDCKYNVESVAILFKLKLLNVQTVDTHIAQSIEAGNPKAIQFATQLMKFFFIEHASMFSDIDFVNIMDAVNKAASNSRITYQNSELRDIMEVIKMNYETNINDRVCATALSMMYTGVTQARDFDDPAQLKEKSEQLLQEWIQHHTILPNRENTKAFQTFVLQMNSQGLFKTDDMITRFFRICTEICVQSCYNVLNLPKGQRSTCYQSLDAFVKLIILLVKHSGDQTNHINKINLFNKVLGLIGGCLLYDQESKGTQFEPMPFQRLLYMLLFEATLPENNLEAIMPHILQAFVNVYHIIRPNKAPGFAYSWLELVSHRIFLSRMLHVAQPTPDQTYKSWNMYAIILMQLIRFLAPFLRNIELTQAVMLLYKGTLRLFLVLLHDFPEFLCSYHYQFCDVIPSNCIQLRNLVLSAFPRSMKLPDPLTPNLKVDMIGDIDSNPPKITFQYTYNIPQKLKNDLDLYIRSRSPVTFLSELRSYLQATPDPGCHYNIQLMNALVIYVGTLGIQALKSRGVVPSLTTLTHASHSAHSDIFQSLVADLDSEGRYLFINAVANQLRYPNSHTHYFGCALLNLFSEANSEAIQEQITRVLLERLIVNRPHPWGLLVTFIELIRNPQFKFWQHQFVHCAPEIEK